MAQLKDMRVTFTVEQRKQTNARHAAHLNLESRAIPSLPKVGSCAKKVWMRLVNILPMKWRSIWAAKVKGLLALRRRRSFWLKKKRKRSDTILAHACDTK